MIIPEEPNQTVKVSLIPFTLPGETDRVRLLAVAEVLLTDAVMFLTR